MLSALLIKESVYLATKMSELSEFYSSRINDVKSVFFFIVKEIKTVLDGKQPTFNACSTCRE